LISLKFIQNSISTSLDCWSVIHALGKSVRIGLCHVENDRWMAAICSMLSSFNQGEIGLDLLVTLMISIQPRPGGWLVFDSTICLFFHKKIIRTYFNIFDFSLVSVYPPPDRINTVLKQIDSFTRKIFIKKFLKKIFFFLK